MNRVRQQLIWCWKLELLGSNNYHMSGECHGKPQCPWQGFLGSTPFQSHALGTYPKGTRCFAKLSIIIQIHLSDPTGVLLIIMSGNLPNVLFWRLSLKSQKMKSIFMLSIQAVLCVWMSKAEKVRLSAGWTQQQIQLSQGPCHISQITPAIKSHPASPSLFTGPRASRCLVIPPYRYFISSGSANAHLYLYSFVFIPSWVFNEILNICHPYGEEK